MVLGTITAFSETQHAGHILLDDGTEVQFSTTAVNGLAPAIGKRVRVTGVVPYGPGVLRAVAVEPADAAAAEPAQYMDWSDVEVEPLSTGQRRAFETRLADGETRWNRQEALDAEARRKAEQARLARAGQEPAKVWGPVLRAAGVPNRVVRDVLASGRATAGMCPAEGPRSSISSRHGGLPDVPRTFCWPRFEDRPLTFVFQLRICEVPLVVRRDLHLPPDGVLSFFFDAITQPCGLEPAHRGGARVFLFAAVDRLVRAAVPEDLDDDGFEERNVDFLEEFALPSPASPAGAVLALSAAVAAAYASALEAECGMRGALAKVGGYADEVQGAMEIECAGVTHGLSFADGTPVLSREIRAEASRWRLLLQVDSMEWVSGTLYYWIREDHLLANAFDHTWCIAQCS